MILIYDDRDEMQRSMKRAGITEVFVSMRDDTIRVTALIDNRSLALFVRPLNKKGVEDEIAVWKAEHFETFHGEVTCEFSCHRSSDN